MCSADLMRQIQDESAAKHYTQLSQVSLPRIRQHYKCHFKGKSNKALGFGASPSEKGAATDILNIELQYCAKEKHRKMFFRVLSSGPTI